MDKLAKTLRDDADGIEVEISADLQYRIDASLHSIEPEKAPVSTVPARPALFWWASSLTGLAAAVVTIVVVNQFGNSANDPTIDGPMRRMATAESTPVLEWRTQPAMLTSPLQAELAALQADIKKAEQKVKEDIGL